MEKEYLKPLINDLCELISDYIKKFCDTNNVPYHHVSGLLDESIDSSLRDHGFKIGTVGIKNRIISAPLAGISDNTYRIFAGSFGCGNATCAKAISATWSISGCCDSHADRHSEW